MNVLSKKCFFMFFENTVPMRLRMQPKFVNVEKMAGIFTKRIWRPYCRLLFKNFCILYSLLNRCWGFTAKLPLQGKFEFHKSLEVIRCCLGIPGKSGEAHQHLLASLVQLFIIKLSCNPACINFKSFSVGRRSIVSTIGTIVSVNKYTLTFIPVSCI